MGLNMNSRHTGVYLLNFRQQFVFRIKHLTNANSELRRQLEELREGTSGSVAPHQTTPAAALTQLKSPTALAPLELLRPSNLPFKLVPEAQKSLLRLSVPTSVPVPVPVQACVKSINGLCFCVNCLIANTGFKNNKWFLLYKHHVFFTYRYSLVATCHIYFVILDILISKKHREEQLKGGYKMWPHVVAAPTSSFSS